MHIGYPGCQCSVRRVYTYTLLQCIALTHVIHTHTHMHTYTQAYYYYYFTLTSYLYLMKSVAECACAPLVDTAAYRVVVSGPLFTDVYIVTTCIWWLGSAKFRKPADKTTIVREGLCETVKILKFAVRVSAAKDVSMISRQIRVRVTCEICGTLSLHPPIPNSFGILSSDDNASPDDWEHRRVRFYFRIYFRSVKSRYSRTTVLDETRSKVK